MQTTTVVPAVFADVVVFEVTAIVAVAVAVAVADIVCTCSCCH